MKFRFINEDGLRQVIRQALPAGRARDAMLAAADRWLARQPRHPRLVGSTAAAKILGIQPPHIARLKEQGRMPDPIKIEGSVEVYLRDQIEDLGRALEAERQERKERKAAREADAA